ncbi:four helix bundle protein [Fusobacteria bacterium ZRK30]|nr:four helix bundle protein [Fusobacteria bacterium ZRK30]
MRRNSIVYDKSFKFAIRIVKLYKHLKETKKEYIMSKQLMRCGTSIGANVSEGIEAQSKKDFISKLSIALKEANESRYWINLMKATDYLDEKEEKSLIIDLEEIIKLLVSIIKTSKENS